MSEQERPQYIASLSYGKDSLAMLHVITDVLHWQLDRIVTADVWATDTIPAELPPMIEFKDKADRIIKERWGIEVEHFRSKKTFEDVFYHVRQRGKYVGQIAGFPMVGNPECNAELKRPVFKMVQKSISGAIQYIGIACDEERRAEKHTKKSEERKIRLPLVEAKWTEQMCMDWCRGNGLLAPTYSISSRGGCWFCPNQSVGTLRALRKEYPQLWELLLKWDADCPKHSHFSPSGRTVHDYEKRFQYEDDGYLLTQKQFRWEDIENPQTNIFQFLGNGKETT